MSVRKVVLRLQQQCTLLVGLAATVLFAFVPAAHAGGVNILSGKGGGGAAPAAAASQAAAQQGAAAAQQAAQQSINALTKASQAIQALRAAQSAARSLAIQAPTNVTNGLSPGGLVVDPRVGTDPSLWVNASKPTQQVTNGQVTVTIEQQAQKALLTWQQFNVGRETTVRFDQSKGNAASGNNWVALNRINAGGAPSQILGQIKAEGTVLLINPNGIIFNGSSQINVGSLIASSASIDPAAFMSTGIYSTQSGSTYLPSFINAGGKISVEAGAEITTAAPKSVTSGGGYVMLMGTEVSNSGTISTPKGQALLSAGDSFILRSGYSTASNQFSTTRGTEISPVIAVGSAAGKVTNAGLIFAQQGDITLAGHEVTQGGILAATTSVNQRGTIHLLNAMSDATGSVTLTSDAITAILPELDSKDTALNAQRDALIAASGPNVIATGQFNNLSTLADRLDQSRVEIVTGGNAVFQGGSYTAAQGGQIAVQAGKRIFTETGATLDVSGVQNVLLPMGSNNISVNVQGNELHDSPQNRDSGYLANENVWIDVRNLTLVPAGTGGYASDRYYTPGGLLEVGGYLGNTAHSIGEWTAVGGTITLSAPEVVTQKGSIFNLSGGSVAYQGGYLRTTNFLGADGRLYNIGDNAPADMKYYGVGEGFIRDHEHWGQTEVWMNPFGLNRDSYRWEDGYTVGRDAGRLVLSTPTSVFEGDILASVIQGERQINARPTGLTDGYKATQNTAALAGQLAVGQYGALGLAGGYNSDIEVGDIAAISGGMTSTTALTSDRANTVYLDATHLSEQKLGGLNFASNKQINFDAPVSLANGAQVSLVAPAVNVSADITAHSGSVTVSNILKAATGTSALINASGGADLTLAAGATIDTTGLWVNGAINQNALSDLAFLNGGNVTFDSTQNATLAEGSVIDVSSGGAILPTGKTQGGKGGNVTIKAGDAQQNATSGDGTLVLDGTIRAYGVTGGGTLTISSPGNLVIGDNAALAGGVLEAGTPAPTTVKLKEAFSVPAGTPLPTALTVTLTTVPLDTPTLVAIPLGSAPLVTTTLAKDWPVPAGLAFNGTNGQAYGGPFGQAVAPAGTVISYWHGAPPTLPAGFIFPSDVFPQGIGAVPSYQVTYAAGSVQSTPMTYPVGAIIAAGAVLTQTVAIESAPSLSRSFFNAGFSKYDVNGGQGVVVSGNLTVGMPVYQFTSNSYVASTGSDPSQAMQLWTPPLFTENPLSASLSQRAGASLSLRSQSTAFGAASLGGGSIVVDKGASVAVDPGQSIAISSFGQLNIFGDLIAHGGSITVANIADGSQSDAGRNFDAQGRGRGISLWIDGNAKLDVSGVAYSATNSPGRSYGTATDGGSITINGGGAFVLLRPGAVLDADGTQTVVDVASGSVVSPVTWGTNGGSISISSSSGLYLDGNMHAFSGGANASGGSLSVAINTPVFQTHSFANDAVPTAPIVPSTLVVTQGYQASTLPTDIAPGTDIYSLQFGHTTISADRIKAGGFDSLALTSGDYMQFSGDVSLALGRSLTLTASAFTSGVISKTALTDSLSSGAVDASAPYVLLYGPYITVPDGSTRAMTNPSAGGAPTNATFTAHADQIDIRGLVQFGASTNVYDSAIFQYIYSYAPGFNNVNLISSGDIRFLPLNIPASGAVLTADQRTMLGSDWSITLDAAQIYPATNVIASVQAGLRYRDPATALPSNSNIAITVGRTTSDIPAVPFSVFGTLALSAPVVNQGGIIRAPLGNVILGSGHISYDTDILAREVNVLPGSITSVSLDGLTLPYGGTIDGVTYTYNGVTVSPAIFTDYGQFGMTSGVSLNGQSVNVASGAIVDVSGGGTLAGAGFISGRGGSVNVLTTPLVNANPFTALSKGSDKVYAIIPGYAPGYAPVAPENGAGDPAIGQQVTIPAGVPGLTAGTYTLLPANYALLPGAYRVELAGSTVTPLANPVAMGSGTYATTVSTSVANTAITSSLPVTALITSGKSVRAYSQYNEQGYSDFFVANTAQFGGARPLLPTDARTLQMWFENPTAALNGKPALAFDGTALLQGAEGGRTGQVVLLNVGEINAGSPTAGFTSVSVSGDEINAIGAPRLMVNGYNFVDNGAISFSQVGNSSIAVRDGVTLKSGEIFLVGGNVSVGNNVTLTTIGQGAASFDSDSTGMGYAAGSTSVLALSNGDLEFFGANGSGAITVGANSNLYSEGTLAIATSGPSTIAPNTHFGSRSIALAVGAINIGDPSTIAAAGNPSGLLFDQALFNTLVNGDPLRGAPALEAIKLSAAQSINLFGTTSVDATGTGVDLTLNTPAIYGYGGAGDVATIAADKITWNGIAGATPPAIAAGGPGNGNGMLNLVANEVDFGQFTSLDTTTPNRVAYGFSNVNITGRSKIVSAGNSKLYVYRAPSSATGAVFGQSGVGGNLTLSTPLLTGVQKSIMAYNTGGMLSVLAPADVAPSAAKTTVSGAELNLTGDSVAVGTTVLLPSGKFVVNATNDIVLDGNSRIDLSGQPSMIQKATVYGFGGAAIFNSAQGNFTQHAGSLVDVSAINNAAGSITASASNGAAVFGGLLNGTATGGYTSGDFSITTGRLSSDNFAALNARLNQGGFFDARSFDIRTGDLTIGNGIKARNVTVATDAGSLTVVGTIDASGFAPGTIRLSAGNGLTLASSAVLDAHGNVLQVDSYGQPIEAKNRGNVELTAAGGSLVLSPGATMNLTTPNGIGYGDIQLNAQRTGEISGDIAIAAGGPLNIRGAYSIALNGFWTYNLPGGSVITQATLDGYDVASTEFIGAALGNAGLQSRVAGLTAYGSAYHLRPGVQITSSGDLSTSGDIDLAKYRYGANANRDPNSASYGAGEPMALAVRAAGGLTVKGSISDGFKGSAGTPATYDPIDIPNDPNAELWSPDDTGLNDNSYVYTSGVTLISEWTVPNDQFYQDMVSIYGVPFVDINGRQYGPGSTIPAGTTLDPGPSLGGNGYLFFDIANLPSIGAVATPGIPGASAASAMASMLAPGSLAASIRLVAGADIAAADPRAVLSAKVLNGGGNLTLNDAAYNSALNGKFFSVLRTGTGNLDLFAGGSFSEASPFGVYTAGTQSASILAPDGSNPYDLVSRSSGGNSSAWYPEHGGDVVISAQQDVTGYIQIAHNPARYVDSDLTSNWLFLQGGGASSDPAAWYINFGSSAKTDQSSAGTQVIGFQGIGTLGGGNLTVIAGRNAGVNSANDTLNSTGLDLAVASTGRVLPDGSLVQTGGGDLILKVGGVLNPLPAASANGLKPDYFGAITDLRGNISIVAGAVGTMAQNTYAKNWTSYDPRAVDPNVFQRSLKTPGAIFTPGDGTVTINARGDLVVGGASDAGMAVAADINGNPYTTSDGTFVADGGATNFTLWRPGTAIDVYAAGGDVALMDGNPPPGLAGASFYPGTLIAAAANGNIRFAEGGTGGNGNLAFAPIELVPSPTGQLELLSGVSIFGTSQIISMSGADMSTLATPFHPVFTVENDSNASANAAFRTNPYSPIAFGEDTPVSYLHAVDDQPARVYAGVDIVDLTIGQKLPQLDDGGNGFIPSNSTWYIAAKPFEVIAGRDIVGTGPNVNVFANNNATDISLVQAGRDIFQETVAIVGPGLLQVQAGRNLYQGYYGSLVSVGDIVSHRTTEGGASITAMAGVGADGPDYADFAKLYFDAANQLPSDGTPLAGSGKVAHAYDQELLAWLKERFGYNGSASDALAYFLKLPSDQQGVFVRQVYYDELKASGREYTNSLSPRPGSYLRGRQAIAMLFPDADAAGNPLNYAGKITMFSSITGSNTINGVTVPVVSDAGINTQFGGDIQILNPGGQTIVGVEGITPGPQSGLITQGKGDIDVYSLGSILLGQSRIMTTFGGDIVAWSATGDINAGRGSKTTVIFTPPKRLYDNYGHVTLSPQAPASGAGIATLNPIPDVPPGDIDLIAPLGTIDAGEAGIRVSGNINLAALQIINTANIQVQGATSGIPVVQPPNVSGLTQATNTASATTKDTSQVANQGAPAEQPSIIIVEVVGYGGGDGGEGPSKEDKQRKGAGKQSYNTHSAVQYLGAGPKTSEQKKKILEQAGVQ